MHEVLGGNPEFLAGNCFFLKFSCRNSIDCTCFQPFKTGELEDEFGMESLQIAARISGGYPQEITELAFPQSRISMRRSLKSLTIGHRPFF